MLPVSSHTTAQQMGNWHLGLRDTIHSGRSPRHLSAGHRVTSPNPKFQYPTSVARGGYTFERLERRPSCTRVRRRHARQW